MSFVDAVQKTPEITDCLKPGLQALGTDRNKIRVDTTRALEGSVDMDKCLGKLYPNDARWDYAFGYKGRVYYVEVHPAHSTGEVKNVIAKCDWLKRWRKRAAPNLEELEHRSTYHWVSSGRTEPMLKSGRYRRLLSQNGIQVAGSVLKTDAVS